MEREEAKDAGLALILILLLIVWWPVGIRHPLIVIVGAVVLVCMLAPKALIPFAIFWYGLSWILAAVVSRIVLTLVYLVMVVPMGLARQLAGADPMLRKRWKKNDGSVFVKRNHTYHKDDICDPY